MTFNIEVLKSNCCRYVTKNSTSLLLSLHRLMFTAQNPIRMTTKSAITVSISSPLPTLISFNPLFIVHDERLS